MFLEVLNEVNSLNRLHKPKSLLYYGLNPFRKFLLELLAINHSSSEMNYIFVPDGLL